MVAASSWVDEFIQRYETQGLGLWDDLDSDWDRRTHKYGIRRPTQDGSSSIGPLICGVTRALFIVLLL